MSDASSRPVRPVSLFDRLKTALRRWSGRNGEPSLRASLEEVIEEHSEEPGGESLREDERSMLLNLLDYGDLRIEDIMVPRADIIAVDLAVGFSELVATFAEAAHSRLPVYRNSLDEVVGMVHVKDALTVVARGKGGDWSQRASIGDIQRPVLFVAPSMKVADLLAKMRASRTHMAVVVDEYGGTDGLVTIEDLVEQIVGDIEDEHDAADTAVLTELADGNWDADARVPLQELEQHLQCDLLPDQQDEDIETVGGLVFTLAGRVPQIGECIDHDAGFRFEVVDADPRRIHKLRIYRPERQAPAGDGD